MQKADFVNTKIVSRQRIIHKFCKTEFKKLFFWAFKNYYNKTYTKKHELKKIFDAHFSEAKVFSEKVSQLLK